MKTFVRCAHLFTGQEDEARSGETLVFDERGTLEYVGPEKGAPRRARKPVPRDDEIRRLRREVARLRDLLREHGIDPGAEPGAGDRQSA